jgi:hypothetical protein
MSKKQLNLKKKSTSVLFILTLFFFLVPVGAGAQSPGLGLSLKLSAKPENPEPGKLVTFSIQNYIKDLDRSLVSWFVNGSLVSQGVGKTTYEFKNSKSGVVYNVLVEVLFNDGSVSSDRLSITPSSVDLIWEADSYVPPFYKGKSLHAGAGKLKIVAVPDLIENGSRQSQNSLVYTWEKDGEIISKDSGYGKYVIEIDGSQFGRPLRIGVTAESLTGNVTAKKTIIIPVSQTKILLYENNPLIGVRYERALEESFGLKDRELVIDAYPYHFSSLSKNDASITYEWAVGKTKVPSSEDFISRLILRKGDDPGEQAISLKATSLSHILQRSLTEFSLIFGSDE